MFKIGVCVRLTDIRLARSQSRASNVCSSVKCDRGTDSSYVRLQAWKRRWSPELKEQVRTNLDLIRNLKPNYRREMSVNVNAEVAFVWPIISYNIFTHYHSFLSLVECLSHYI